MGKGDGLKENRHGYHGNLGVGGVQDLPHRWHNVIVLQPDEKPPLLLASLKQNLVMGGCGYLDIENEPTSSLRARDLSVSRV